MRLLGFSVMDQKVGAFAHPFFATAIGLAVRMFGDWCNDQGTPLSKHPEDYQLFQVGYFDDESGQFEAAVVPKLVSSGADHVVRQSVSEVARRSRQNPGLLDAREVE